MSMVTAHFAAPFADNIITLKLSFSSPDFLSHRSGHRSGVLRELTVEEPCQVSGGRYSGEDFLSDVSIETSAVAFGLGIAAFAGAPLAIGAAAFAFGVISFGIGAAGWLWRFVAAK